MVQNKEHICVIDLNFQNMNKPSYSTLISVHAILYALAVNGRGRIYKFLCLKRGGLLERGSLFEGGEV